MRGAKRRSNPAFLPPRRKLDCFRLRSPSFGGLPTRRSLRSKRRRVAALAMTWKQQFSFSRHDLSELCKFIAPSLEQRAQGRPGAGWHPQAPCAMGRKKRTRLHEYSQDIPAFPAQWLYGLYVLFPVSGLCCHRCQARTGGPDRRQGRGARTTRFRRTLQRFRRACRSKPHTASVHRNPRHVS